MQVDIWFDPICPFAWITSRWLREVAEVRPVQPRWHLMSQAILNEDRADLTAEQRATLTEMMKPLRVLTAARARGGPSAMLALYTELGRRLHDEGLRHRLDVLDATVGDALGAAGLDAGLVKAMAETGHDAEIRASHTDAATRVGPAAGTPVIEVDGAGGRVAFFGPVLSPAPRGEAAGRLWDGLLLLAGAEGFYEIKRSRTGVPDFG